MRRGGQLDSCPRVIPVEPVEPFKTFQIRWAEPVGRKECPYMYRWAFLFMGYGIRLHHWVASDDQRHFHDHPWWMLVIILWGGYLDISPDGVDLVGPGSVRFRPAVHRHTVAVFDQGCWSLLLTGRPARHWGFYVAGRDRLLRPLKYFSRHGHHQCTEENR